MPCNVCTSLICSRSGDKKLSLWMTPLALLTSAASGCPYCLLLRDSISGYVSTDNLIERVRMVYVSTRAYGNGNRTKIELFWKEGETYEMKLEMYVLEDTPVPLENLRVIDVIEHTGSNSKTRWIKEKLARCSEHHDCDPVRPATWMPTRILKISNDMVRLWNTKRKPVIYACLSHCWGTGSKRCTTTKATIKARQASIMWNDLPKTFQDAITVARELDIDYLWIDSLCVIQDSEEDWQRESAGMASVYRNALLTLAATSSRDSDGGLWFGNENTPVMVPFSNNGITYTIYVRKRPVHWPAATERYNNQTFPLLNRGWVYQERILSPRFLHFGKDELVWECQQESRCECGGYTLDHWTGGKYGQKNTDQAAIKWRKIVEEYSAKALSVPSDCLPALSGLAKVNRPLACDYLAGMWRNSLNADLLWRVDTSTLANAARPSVYRAPSWAWPSVDAPITYWSTSFYDQMYAKNVDCWKIKSADVSLSGLDPTGQVSGGILEVEGACLDAFVELDEGPSNKAAAPVCFVRYAGFKTPFFADFNFGVSNNFCPSNVILLRATMDVSIVLSPDCNSASTYQRVGISRRSPFQSPFPKWGPERKIRIR